jgi:hypothetical protein
MCISRSLVRSLIGSFQDSSSWCYCMRLAFLSRHWLHPMQLGHHFLESSSFPPSTQNTHKRSLGADAHAFSYPQPFTQQSNTDTSPVHPAKLPRSASVKTPREAMRAFSSSSKKHLSSAQGGRQGYRSDKKKKARQPGSSFHTSSIPALPREDDPVHDAEYINRVHQKVPLKKAWEQNPKSPLSNVLDQLGANPPVYRHVEVSIFGNRGWRQVYCTRSALPPLILVGRRSRPSWRGMMKLWV